MGILKYYNQFSEITVLINSRWFRPEKGYTEKKLFTFTTKTKNAYNLRPFNWRNVNYLKYELTYLKCLKVFYFTSCEPFPGKVDEEIRFLKVLWSDRDYILQ